MSELDLGDGRGLRRFTRETNTMPNWAGSCWYLRYLDPANHDAMVDPANEEYWIGRGERCRRSTGGPALTLVASTSHRWSGARGAAPALCPLLAQRCCMTWDTWLG